MFQSKFKELYFLKLGALIAAIACFVVLNWGSTFKGLQHLVLTIRTYPMPTLPQDLYQLLVSGLIPFGETVANFLITLAFYFLCQFLIAYIYPGKFFKEWLTQQTVKENRKLRDELILLRIEVEPIFDQWRLLIEQRHLLENYQDKLNQISVSLQNLNLILNPPKNSHSKEDNEPVDLFTAARRASKAKRPPKRRRPSPKF